MQKPLQHIGLQLIERGVKIEIDAFDTAVNQNRARVTTTQDDEHVRSLVQSFTQQGWNEELGYAIAVLNPDTNTPVLIDGHHRADAWSKLGNETLPCDYYKLTGICSLDSIIAQVGLKANDHPPAKSNTKNDVKRVVSELIATLNLEPTVDEIVDMIRDIGLKGISKAVARKIASEIYRDEFASSKIVTARKQTVQKFVQDNVKDYGKHVNFSMPCTAKDGGFYHSRNVMDCIDYFNQTGGEVPTGVVYALEAYDPQEVYEARKSGVNKMKEMFDSIRDVVNSMEPGEYPWEILGAYPQIEQIEGDSAVIYDN